MRIFLIGFMGSGKSSLGKDLSNKLGFAFIDLDDAIEKKSGKTISNIFNEEGEKYFRNIEHECLKDVILTDNVVVATGGGTPCFCNNMELINLYGISLYIKLNTGILTSRLYLNKSNRPLINSFSKKEDLQKYIEKNLNEREKFFPSTINFDCR
ncbi:MAG: shikimate kinase [Bacteroidetes bacterium]|nr:shikimate kinase [Bacteroidota bacterium]